MRGFNSNQLRMIGFTFVMQQLQPATPYGQEKKKQLEWFDRSQQMILIRLLDELTRFLQGSIAQPEKAQALRQLLARFKEIRGILRKLERQNELLDETDLFELKNFAIDCDYLMQSIQQFGFHFDLIQLQSLKPVIDLLNPQEQITRTFSIYDEYAPELAHVRQEKARLEKQIAAESADVSSLMAQRANIIEREHLAETKVRAQLSAAIRAYVTDFRNNTDYLAELDFLQAKAALARQYPSVCPAFHQENILHIQGAQNPYVADALLSQGKVFTPITLNLKQGANVLTGANMGGKTVALATVTLNCLLAHCGFYVFAQQLALPILDYLFYLASDEQSVSQGLSSFGAEVKSIAQLLQQMHHGTGFCALDEFARGTNPEEGQQMVRAFLQLAERFPCFCLISTHFSGVLQPGMNHFQVVGLKLAQLDSSMTAVKSPSYTFLQDLMDFSIEPVAWNSPAPRDALRVAALMGLPEEFLTLVSERYKENE